MSKRTQRKYDQSNFYRNAFEYIPIACHFDKNTLLTKNGELVQTIQINGINSEKISDDLKSLRESIRVAIAKHANLPGVSCWIHTVRQKRNLNDDAPYPTLLSHNIHEIWRKKNYWHDKFVNTLFITFVYEGANLRVQNLNSFLLTFFTKKIESFHEGYLEIASKKLNQITANFLEELQAFGAQRLGIVYRENKPFSEILELFVRILKLKEEPVEIAESSLSHLLGNYEFAVGSDKIEVRDNVGKKFAAMLSFKEYHEASAEYLDKFLQLSLEMVVTEAFYVIDKDYAKKYINHQNYILSVAKDKQLLEQKGITKMLEKQNEYAYPFCNQQISVMIIDEELTNLEENVTKASRTLSDLGFLHVREDINVENAFWAQVPGNFKYFRRMAPVVVEEVAAMASLHNFPSGEPSNPWGKAVTLLRTEKGTPYFFNFHDEKQNPTTFILGTKGAGKTILQNFLLTEAMKYQPSILHIATDNTSEVFTLAQGGDFIEDLPPIDPFTLNIVNTTQVLMREFLILFTGISLSAAEEDVIDRMVKFLEEIPLEQRNLKALGDFPFESEIELKIKENLNKFLPNGEHFSKFDVQEEWEFTPDYFINFNFKKLLNKNVTDGNVLEDNNKYAAIIDEVLKISTRVREILLFSYLLKFIENCPLERKIIVIDNMNYITSGNLSEEFYNYFIELITLNNGVLLSSVEFEPEDSFFQGMLWNFMANNFGTKIYFPSEKSDRSWQQLWNLSDSEFKKLSNLKNLMRLFLIKQDGLSIITELSLGGLIGVLKLFSANEEVISQCKQMIAEKGHNPDDWIIELYDSIR